MCALVQAIRKVGVVGSGPGLGAAANPMHIIRDVPKEDLQSSKDGPSSPESDTSLEQERRIAEDPSTQVDDDREPQLRYEYYEEEVLDRQLPGELSHKRDNLGADRDADIQRGKSFGRRRRQVPTDLEKGQV